MTCKACGYNDEVAKYRSGIAEKSFDKDSQTLKAIKDYVKPFIEIYGLERGPKFYELQGDGYTYSAVAHGKPITAYACPVCGTIKMEV